MSVKIQHDQEPFLVYLSLGSNIDPEANLPKAIQKLSSIIEVVAVSSIWQTPAVGFEGEDFLNAVVAIQTLLPPDSLKYEIIRPLETLLGRTRTREKFSSRTIDIDILLYPDELVDEELWFQPHLAVPLAELNPEYARKETGETLIEVASNLQKNSRIQLRKDL